MNIRANNAIDWTRTVQPGCCIGILGDGQLGRMLALAAAARGYRTAVLGPGGRNSPAGQVSFWAEAWDSDASVPDTLLDAFCEHADVVLVEWENVPVSLVRRIEAKGIRVCCGSRVLEIAQDRIKENAFAQSLGISVPGYEGINRTSYRAGHMVPVSEPRILKTCRDGYDGKGQIRINVGETVHDAWSTLNQVPCILESVVDFTHELSVIVARSPYGMCCYGPFVNRHVNGILRTSVYPSGLPKHAIENAQTIGTTLARALDVHGLLAVEMFLTSSGRVLFNEMAPRPHNSGHLTIECCDTSQFEQHVLAACNMPLGSARFHSRGEMTNIIGDDVLDLQEFFCSGERKVHLYGKEHALPDRKMGHITRRWNTSDARTM